MKGIELLNLDCLTALQLLEDKSIDLILTDPPYGTTACKWDSVIPFEPMWRELKRIRKDNAAICIFGQNPFTANLIMSNANEYQYDWIWDKKVGVNFLHAKRQPLKVHELISVFCARPPNYYPTMTLRDKPIKKGANYAGETSGYKLDADKYKGKTYTHSYPRTILNFSKDSQSHNNFHPTQKPVALLEYLIKTYTLEGETVLDFTMGSGSTGVACANLGRKFIGIEKDDEYFKIAEKRIKGNTQWQIKQPSRHQLSQL